MRTSSASTKSGGVFWSSDSEDSHFGFSSCQFTFEKKTQISFLPPPPAFQRCQHAKTAGNVNPSISTFGD